MRERGAEERAMENQDYDELMIQMERNEILMLTHQFRQLRIEDVFLAYYQNRKFMDIWSENKHKPSEIEEVEPTFKTRETDINRDEDAVSMVQDTGSGTRKGHSNKDDQDEYYNPPHNNLREMSVPRIMDSIQHFIINEYFTFSISGAI